ncbi:MAG: hypothetical protein HC890_00660 [Chloroflexaceae bacterium]|nr:hypothetical protein [Chloroflexaceae bacterium]
MAIATPQPRLAPSYDKRYLDLSQNCAFQATPLPLGAIYLLQGTAGEEIGIQPCEKQEGWLALIGESYRYRWHDSWLQKQEFSIFGRLAASVPLRRLNNYRNLAKLPQLTQAILQDFATLPCIALPTTVK